MLKGKTALITGSTSGIGAGIAEKFASLGANVIITGLTTEKDDIQGFLAKIQNYGVKACYQNINLLDENGCETLIAESKKLTGKIDILINNAGAQYVSPIEAFPIKKWDFILKLNLTVPFQLSQAVLPIMRAHDFGRIINIASAHGLIHRQENQLMLQQSMVLLVLVKLLRLKLHRKILLLILSAQDGF